MNNHTKRIFELCGILDSACSLIDCETAAIKKDYKEATPATAMKFMALITLKDQLNYWKNVLYDLASVDKIGEEKR